MELTFGGSDGGPVGMGKVVCVVDQSVFQYLNQRTENDFYFEGCAWTPQSDSKMVVQADPAIRDSFSYEFLDVDGMAKKLKADSPLYSALPVALVKERLLESVARNLQRRAGFLPQKLVFVVLKTEGNRVYAQVDYDPFNSNIDIKPFRWK